MITPSHSEATRVFAALLFAYSATGRDHCIKF